MNSPKTASPVLMANKGKSGKWLCGNALLSSLQPIFPSLVSPDMIQTDPYPKDRSRKVFGFFFNFAGIQIQNLPLRDQQGYGHKEEHKMGIEKKCS